MASSTTIPVSDETWEELNSRKSRGQTYDDLIKDLLGGDGE